MMSLEPLKILERAEVLAFLEDYRAARLLLELLSPTDQRKVRAVALRLRILQGQEAWQEGTALAGRVRPSDDPLIRQAAGLFLRTRARHCARAGRTWTATETLKAMHRIWPEAATALRCA